MSKLAPTLALSVLVACSGGNDPGGDPDPSTPDAGTSAPEPDARPATPIESVALPQAVGGAMWANPDAQAEVPVQVDVDGDPIRVSVTAGGTEVDATDPEGDGRHTATLPIAQLTAGPHTLTATAVGSNELVATAELHVGRSGVQLTDVDVDGNAGTPRLHRVGDELWLTWTDGLDQRKAWLRKLDGAGRWVGDRVELVGADGDDILKARTAVGDGTIAVLYQQPGGPYANYVTVVDPDGDILMPAIPLDPETAYGSSGGDVVYDGSGFVLTWRINDGAGGGEIRWMRIAESDFATTGPITVAASGNDDPIGGFQPHSFITVLPLADRSMISFVRDQYDPVLELSIPRCQVAVVDHAGDVAGSEMATSGSGFFFDHECRLFADDVGPILLWSSDDLTSPQQNPPTGFYAARADASTGVLDPNRLNGMPVLQAPMYRSEPFLRTTGGVRTLAWTDERAHQNPTTGHIELYAAPLDGRMAATDEVRFGHARFISGTSQLRGAPAGTNTVLVWIDERNGQGLLDPTPELWLDTVWR